MKKLALSLLMSGLSLSLFHCGNPTPVPLLTPPVPEMKPAPPAPKTPQAQCEAFAKVYCQKVGSCMGMSFDVAQCETGLRTMCARVESQCSSGVKYSSAEADKCITQLGQLSCSAQSVPDSCFNACFIQRAPAPALSGAWIGKKPASGTLGEGTITLDLAQGGGLKYLHEYQYQEGATYFGGCKVRREVSGTWGDENGRLRMFADKGTTEFSECENDGDNKTSDYSADDLGDFAKKNSGPYKLEGDSLTIDAEAKLPALRRK